MKKLILFICVVLAIGFTAPAYAADPNFISHWKFDEGSGTTAYDSSGNNDGTIYGPNWTTGQIDGALDFDGSGDYVKVNDSSSMRSIDGSAADYTICLWAQTSQTGAASFGPTMFERRDTSPDEWVINIYLNADDAIGVLIAIAGGSTYRLNDTLAINDGSWHHITVTRKNTEYVKIYIDGNPRQSGSTTISTSTDEFTTIGVRRTNAGAFTNYFDGKIDDVRIYNRALSAGEILQLCAEGLGGRAFNPNPKDGQTQVDPDIILSWTPNPWAADVNGHDVYFGTDFNDVNDATTASAEYMGNQDANSYDPCGLGLGTTYYWRIDEINDPNLWKGNTWNFRAATPLIDLSATYFEFTAFEGGANPNDQILTITNSGAGTLNWQITEDCNWLIADPNSGSSTAEADDVNLCVDITGLTKGIYDCNLTISDTNAENSPQTVGVNVIVYYPEELLVPSEYSTIQAAIDAAFYGDMVVLATGTYTGTGNRDLDFGGKAITVRSTDPEDPCVVASTIIDCQGRPGFEFRTGETLNSVISGLTITGGRRAVYCSGASVTIAKCTIVNNTTYYEELARGGGIFCTSNSDPTVVDCTIINNKAEGLDSPDWGMDGGDAHGGGIYASSDSHVTIRNCIISNNAAIGGDGDVFGGYNGDAYGGGIYGNVTISNSTISYNSAEIGQWGFDGYARGGGMYCLDGSLVTNCLIVNNFIDGESLESWGSGIYGGDMTIANSTICRNSSSHEDYAVLSEGTATVTNCILWYNSWDLWGCSTTYSCTEEVISGIGNIHTNPLFVDYLGGNYHLLPGSTSIDAGDNNSIPADTLDLDGDGNTTEPIPWDLDERPRFADGDCNTTDIVDMGAYEFNWAYIGDFAGGCDVDLIDFSVFALTWLLEDGQPGYNNDCDISLPVDGIIDERDLEVFCDNWLEGI